MYSGFMALKASAVLTACSSSSSGPPRPVMAVTDSAMPFLRTFCPISMISAAGWPFRMRVRTLSLPDSNPM